MPGVTGPANLKEEVTMPGMERELEIYLESIEENRSETVRPVNEMTEEEVMKFFEDIPF